MLSSEFIAADQQGTTLRDECSDAARKRCEIIYGTRSGDGDDDEEK